MQSQKVDIKSVFVELGSSTSGLSDKIVKEKLITSGFNELEEKSKVTPVKLLFGQLSNFIIWVLLAAAILSLMIDEIVNFWVIIFLIVFVIVLGFIQEYKAEKAMGALKKMVEPTTHAMRNGVLEEILTREIVKGDILVLEAGDKVAADGLVFESQGLKVDESAITGESVSVEKGEEDLIYSGTQIVNGKCRAIVTDTGMNTKLGTIAELIQDVEVLSPLQLKIAELSKILASLALVASFFTFILGYLTGVPLQN